MAGAGLGGRVPGDVWLLLGLLLTGFALQFFAATAWLPELLRLTPAAAQRGYLWQLVTYPFVGTGQPGIWFVLELLILFLFARDAYRRLGRRRFWWLLVGVAAAAGAVASGLRWLAPEWTSEPFVLMQGQRTLLAVLIAAFATLNGEATIYLFFVLPMPARWFLGLEVLFALLGFLATHDLAGFAGVVVAVAATWWWLRRGARGGAHRWRKRAEERWLRWRLRRLQRRRGLRVVRGEGGAEGGSWLH